MLNKIAQFAFIFFLAINTCYPDASANSDSLLLVINNQPESIDKIQNLRKLGNAYRKKDRDSSLHFYNRARLLAQKLNDTEHLIKSSAAMASLYDLQGDFDKSKKYYKSAIATASENNLPKLIPGMYLDMSMVYRRDGQPDSAFFWVAAADQAFDAIGEEYFRWKVHSLIAHLHKDRKEYDKAGKAFEKAWDIVEKGTNRMDKGYLLYMLGSNFFEAENFEKFNVYSQKWREFNQKSEKKNYYADNPDHSPLLILFSPDDPVNIERMRKAIAYNKSVNDNMRTGINQGALGFLLSHQGYEEAALEAFLESEIYLKKANSRIDLPLAYKRIYNSYKKLNDFPRALTYHEKYLMLSDSIKREGVLKNLAELETKYETGQKEKEIQVQELQLATAKRKNMATVVGLFAALFIAGLLFYFYRQKQKDNAVITKALKEKELLLREIHHRVKNNLQVISSLLSLQSRFIEDENALEAIKEGRDRVKSMALIHQNLYQEDNLTGIKVKAYFEKLISSLFNSYNISPERIKLEADIQNINLDVDTIIPLGLIVNELVSNALKHAFPGDRKGTISIQLKEEPTGLQLQVADNGIGWKKEINLEQSDSFGFRMINAFKNRLEAQLEIENKNGAQITMLIKEYEKVA
ncbi:MAG: histidine kinase dimerization/phosphoacceptor domain -containing protein [Bacteroidota bacterium]